jgi:SpoVK/Ycf46/Vps4 family AAA+-type ATPase
VSTLFRKIEAMLDQDNDTFVFVFIDEIESLANTRQYSASSNEPRDSLRVLQICCAVWSINKTDFYSDRPSTLCLLHLIDFTIDLIFSSFVQVILLRLW